MLFHFIVMSYCSRNLLCRALGLFESEMDAMKPCIRANLMKPVEEQDVFSLFLFYCLFTIFTFFFFLVILTNSIYFATFHCLFFRKPFSSHLFLTFSYSVFFFFSYPFSLFSTAFIFHFFIYYLTHFLISRESILSHCYFNTLLH